ncbi:hypothetical protein D3C72_1025750 [compost metagenome]
MLTVLVLPNVSTACAVTTCRPELKAPPGASCQVPSAAVSTTTGAPPSMLTLTVSFAPALPRMTVSGS